MTDAKRLTLGTMSRAWPISQGWPGAMKPFCRSTTTSADRFGSMPSKACGLPRRSLTRSCTQAGNSILCITRYSLLQRHAGQVGEPALRRGVALHFLGEGARVQVMHDEQPRRILDQDLVRLGQLRREVLGLEIGLDLVQHRVQLVALVVAPVRRDRRHVAAVEPAEHQA